MLSEKFQQLKAELAVAYPKVWIKDGREFHSESSECLWTGEGSVIEFVDVFEGDVIAVPAFDMYPMFESTYVFGVYTDLAQFLDARGFYAEAYDAGTFFIYEV